MTETFRDRTLATRYQQRQQLPPNFASVLKEYTREVLREQPEDILSWSAEYFKRLAVEQDPMLAQQPPPEHYAPAVENPELEVMSMKISKVFANMADADSDLLYINLVRRALLEAFGLSKSQALYILSSDYVHINDNGTINYREFSRNCVNALLFFQQSNYEFPSSQSMENPMVHGMGKEELDDELLRVFRAADEEGLGRLPYPKYREALIHAPLQLTHRDINVLCAGAERTSDGFVEFKKAVQYAFESLFYAQAFTSFDEEQAE
jgi:Ca2+-binding EF-hand superfamily protein